MLWAVVVAPKHHVCLENTFFSIYFYPCRRDYYFGSGYSNASTAVELIYLVLRESKVYKSTLIGETPHLTPSSSFLLGVRCGWLQVEVGVVSGKGRFKTLDEDSIEAHLVAINEMES